MRISLINQRGISRLFRDNGRRKISWNKYIFLVGGLEHEFYFPLILGIIIPLTNSYFSRWLLHHQPECDK